MGDNYNKRMNYYTNLHNFYLTIIKQYKNDNIIRIKLLSDYKDIIFILEMNKPEDIKFLYFNKSLIHKILYDSDKNIEIQLDSNEKKSFYYNFYLVLLILDQPDIINYEYSIEYIREINNQNKKTKNGYKLILMSKIIIELINNYRNCNKYNTTNEEEELTKIENECKNIIIAKKKLFLKKEILKKKVNTIFLEILKYLIINKKKFVDNEFMEILELEKIEFDDLMFKELLLIINENKQYIKVYKIKNIKDLLNKDNININWIKNNKKQDFEKLSKFYDKNIYIKEKVEYIFIKLIDTEYYSNLDNKITKLIFKNSQNLSCSKFEKKKLNEDLIIEYFNNKKNKNILLKIFYGSNYIKNNISLIDKTILQLKNKNLKGTTKSYLDKSNIFNNEKEYNNNSNNNIINNRLFSNNSKSIDNTKKKLNEYNYQFSDYLKGQSYKEELGKIKCIDANESKYEKKELGFNKENIEFGFKDIYYEITEILEESIFIFNIKGGKIEIEIKFGNNRSIEYETLLNVWNKKEKNFEIKEYNILYDNFNRLMNYMEKIKENINGKFSSDFRFLIELNAVENIYNNSIKNIRANYILDYENIEENQKYEDENILINGIGNGFHNYLNKLKFIDLLSSQKNFNFDREEQNNLYLYHLENEFNFQNIIRPLEFKEKKYNIFEKQGGNKLEIENSKFSKDNLILEEEYAIGLDLGNTFSCIGVYKNGGVEIIPNKNGEKKTPSVVIMTED